MPVARPCCKKKDAHLWLRKVKMQQSWRNSVPRFQPRKVKMAM